MVSFRERFADIYILASPDNYGESELLLEGRIAGLEVTRQTLEVKYRHATSSGKTFNGEDELLLRLQQLGSKPVAVVSAHAEGKNFYIYVTPATLEPVGAVIMYDSQHDEPAGD